MIRAGFLDADTRKELTALVRDGKAEAVLRAERMRCCCLMMA